MNNYVKLYTITLAVIVVVIALFTMGPVYAHGMSGIDYSTTTYAPMVNMKQSMQNSMMQGLPNNLNNNRYTFNYRTQNAFGCPMHYI